MRVRDLAPVVGLALIAVAVSVALEEPREDAVIPRIVELAGSVATDQSEYMDDSSGRALDGLHAALARAGRGEDVVRIAVYGGSHTASDHYTGRMRELLQQRFGDAGHGFAPLVPVVERQWRWGVRIDAEGFGVVQVGLKHADVARYGMHGVSFQADDEGAFAVVESDTWGSGRFASRISVLYDRRPGGGSFEIWIDGRRVEAVETAAPTPESGTSVHEVSDGPHRVEVRARGDGPVVVFGVLLDRDTPGVQVENLGLVGAKLRHQLFWDEGSWRDFFAPRRPDLIALAYGTNEVEDTHLTLAHQEERMRAAIARLRTGAPEASCLVIGPTDRLRRRADGGLEPEPRLGEIAEMQRAVARDVGCAFFDTLRFQGGPGAGIRWIEERPPAMRDDLVHLTPLGYRRWADALVDALLRGYGTRRSARFGGAALTRGR